MLLDKASWGDEIFITVVSHMWAVSITVLYQSEGNREWKVRHNLPLNQVDFAVLYTGNNHYSAIGKIHTEIVWSPTAQSESCCEHSQVNESGVQVNWSKG